MICQVDKAINLLNAAAKLNLEDPLREGNVIILPNYGQVVMTGDLHGCETNFERLKHFADLQRCPHRQVIVHELIHLSNNHGSSSGQPREDRSCDLLLRALEWKVQFPDQVHFLLGNHDLAQTTGREITKAGLATTAAFNDWVSQQFGPDAEELLEALPKLFVTFPLAARTTTGIFMSHSLPGPYAMDQFDATIFSRDYQPADLLRGGSVYELVWGRGHTAEQLEQLSQMLDVQFFIVGHQGQPCGFDCQFDRMIILASDHYEGCFMPLDLSKRYEFEDLVARIRYFRLVPM